MTRLVGVTVVLGLLASGCGDDDEEPQRVEVTQWAGDVCGAFLDFAGRSAGFVEEFGPVDELAPGDLVSTVGLLDALGQGLAGMEAELAELGDELEASGVPDIDGGERAVATVVGAFDDVRARLQAAVDLIAELGPDDLSADGVAEFQERAADIARGLGSLGEDLEADLPAAARDVLAEHPACDEADDLLTSLEESFVPS